MSAFKSVIKGFGAGIVVVLSVVGLLFLLDGCAADKSDAVIEQAEAARKSQVERDEHRALAEVLVEPLNAHCVGADDYTWDFVSRVTHRGTGARALVMMYGGRPVVINLPSEDVGACTGCVKIVGGCSSDISPPWNVATNAVTAVEAE